MNGGGNVPAGRMRTHCCGGGSPGGAPSISSGPSACDRSPNVPSTASTVRAPENIVAVPVAKRFPTLRTWVAIRTLPGWPGDR